MNEIFSNLIYWLLPILVCIIILGLFGWLKYRHDVKIVTSFLEKSGIDTDDRFISTHSISSATRLSCKRIKQICKSSNHIKGNNDDGDSWKLF